MVIIAKDLSSRKRELVIQTLEKTQRVFEGGIMKWRPGEGMIKSGVCIVRGMFSQRHVPEPTSYLCSSSRFTSLSNLLRASSRLKLVRAGDIKDF
jgi:hypothetical protein